MSTDDDSAPACEDGKSVLVKDMVTVVATFFEIGLFILSCLASYLHFKAAGGRVTTPAVFFICHFTFAFLYVICHLMQLYLMERTVCMCDGAQIQFVLYNAGAYCCVLDRRYTDGNAPVQAALLVLMTVLLGCRRVPA